MIFEFITIEEKSVAVLRPRVLMIYNVIHSMIRSTPATSTTIMAHINVTPEK